MKDSRFISVDDAVRRLEGSPVATIRAQRDAIARDMSRMKAAAPVISLSEYRKFSRAKRILDQVLRRRGAL